ncbi:MAG TPA: hypothetical protein VI011_25000 [Asanoa sp.]
MRFDIRDEDPRRASSTLCAPGWAWDLGMRGRNSGTSETSRWVVLR